MAEKTFEPNLKSENTDVSQTSSQFTEREFMKYYAIKQHVTSAPTYIPKNSFEQTVFYNNGATFRVYYYINNSWHYITLT